VRIHLYLGKELPSAPRVASPVDGSRSFATIVLAAGTPVEGTVSSGSAAAQSSRSSVQRQASSPPAPTCPSTRL
jgi:hypothetical protein